MGGGKLITTFNEMIAVLEDHGFTQIPGRKCQWTAVIEGQRRIVTIDYHGGNRSIATGTLQSMIRQSGLPKAVFRKG